MNIFAAVLLAATALVGPERRIAPPSYGPAYGSQYPQALVSDGRDFLLLWAGVGGVHATIVDESGSPRPSRGPLFRAHVAYAAWAGDAYVLAWFDEQRQTTLTARLSRDGELLSQPVPVSEAVPVYPRAVAASPEGALFVVDIGQVGHAILTGSTSATIPLPAATPHTSAVAVEGGYVVVTAATTAGLNGAPTTSVYATRISHAGAAGPPVLVDVQPNHLTSLHAAASGGRIGLAFVTQRVNLADKERLHTFTLDAATLAAEEHAPVAGVPHARVVAVPGGFAAGFTERSSEDVLALTTIAFGSSTRRTTPIGTVVGGDLYLATNGSTVFGVWRDYRFSPSFELSTSNLFGLALDATAAVPESEAAPATVSAVAQAHPVVASAGDTALVAWVDFTKTVTGELLAMRVDANGNRLDRTPIAIAEGLPEWQTPAVVFTGELWLAVWSIRIDTGGGARTFLRRIALDGTLLDPAPVELTPGGGVAAASNGTLTLVIAGEKLFRFSRAGERLGEQPAGYPGTLASNGREFLLVWNEGSDWWQFPSPNYLDVRAMRLDANGAPLDAVPIDVAVSKANESMPFVTSNGSDFLVLYQHDEKDGDWAQSVRAKRVLASGTLADHTPTSEGSLVAEGRTTYSAAPFGNGYLAVYAREGVRTAIEAVALDARGAAVDAASPLGSSDWWPAWTSAGGRWVAYARTDPALGNIARLFVRVVGEGGPRRRAIRR
jgi:hypothetical protein